MKKTIFSLTLILVMALIFMPNYVNAAATITLVYDAVVLNGDIPTLPTFPIAIASEFDVFGWYVQDTNKNGAYDDDSVIVLSDEMLKKLADIQGMTLEAFKTFLDGEGYTIKNTFEYGYKYTFSGQIAKKSGTFAGNNGDVPQDTVEANIVDVTSNLEIYDGKIAIPVDSDAIVVEVFETKFSKPELKWSETEYGMLTWEPVTNADIYGVKILKDGQSVGLGAGVTCDVDIKELVKQHGVGTYTVEVWSYSRFGSESLISDNAIATYEVKLLDKPELKWSETEYGMLTWEPVKFADIYGAKILKDGQSVGLGAGDTCNLDIKDLIDQHGVGTYTVEVWSSLSSVSAISSDKAIATYEVKPLDKPELKWSETEYGMLTWEPVTNADQYGVNILKDGQSVVLGAGDTCDVDIKDLIDQHGVGTYTVEVWSRLSSVSAISSDKAIATYEEKPAQQYTYTFKNIDTQKFSVQQNKISELILKVDEDFAEFENIVIVGLTLIIDVDYTVKEGSTIITFTEKGLEKLNTLTTGEHEIKVNYANQKTVEGKLVIEEDENSQGDTANNSNVENPKTFDSGMFGYIGLVIVVLSGVVAATVVYRKKQTN